MAQVFLENQIQNVPEIAHYTIMSAGLLAHEGEKSSSAVRAVVRARGLSLENHCAQPLTQAIVDRAAAIICATSDHEGFLRERFVNLPEICTSFVKFGGDVPDPYFGKLEAYGMVADEIEQKVPLIIEFLRKELNDH
jgi:protein-tyrosine phosphatase